MGYLLGNRIHQVYPHHGCIESLWENRWKSLCKQAVYPFFDGKYEDFEEVFKALIEMNLRHPYDFDVYSKSFFPVAERLSQTADEQLQLNNYETARELYLRAAALYRIARFPMPLSEVQKLAWKQGKEVYIKGARLLDTPIEEFWVKHTYAIMGEASQFPIYLCQPRDASLLSPVPCVIIVCGLDAYRTDISPAVKNYVDHGFACLAVEIPGTGDSPALKDDPTSPDRQWSSLLDWIAENPSLNNKKIAVHGISTGGYYAMRIAHTHADRLHAVVAHGGGCHHMFDPEWIDAIPHLEYPFDLDKALAHKFGFENTEQLKELGQRKFSLVVNKIFEMPCSRLLVVNGMDDSIFPIEDSLLALSHGQVKEARFVPGASHMGGPVAALTVHHWIKNAFNKP